MRNEPLPARVLDAIRAEGLIVPGDDVTAALSGGADSVALLALLRELRAELGFTLRAAHCAQRSRQKASSRSASAPRMPWWKWAATTP